MRTVQAIPGRCAGAALAVGLFASLVGIRPVAGQCEDAVLRGPDGVETHLFDRAVALRGAVAACGAPSENDETGAVYLFHLDDGDWSCTQRLGGPVQPDAPRFGASLSLEPDLLVVGTPRWGDGFGSQPGAAMLYRPQPDGTWLSAGRVTAADGVSGDQFGASVSRFGDRILVGAPFDHVGSVQSGSAYVYRFDGSTWIPEAHLVDPGGLEGDLFGFAVALGDGVALVGAPDHPHGSAFGVVHVFRRSGANWSWTQATTASDPDATDWYGRALALSADRALVGAWGWGDETGAAYVLRDSGTAWAEEARLAPAALAPGWQFGLGLAFDGARALVGAPGASIDRQADGVAYAFVRDGTVWHEAATLRASAPASGDRFGGGVALEAELALIGGQAWADDPKRAWMMMLDGADCDGSGRCDVRDLADGLAADCNGNLVPDACDIEPFAFAAESGTLAPIGATAPQQFVVAAPPRALGTVALAFRAHADLNSALEHVVVAVNGTTVGRVFVEGAIDCAVPPNEDALAIDAATFNALVPVGADAVVDMLPTNGVSAAACQGGSWIECAIAYDAATSLDLDADGRPDECGPACPGDVNRDGAVGFSDLLRVLAAWDTSEPAADVDGSGIVGMGDLTIVLSAWGPCD